MPQRAERGGRLRHGGVYPQPDSGPGVGPPTYTAKGPPAPQLLTGAFVEVGGTTITTAPFAAWQKAIISVSVTLNAGAGTQDNAALRVFDGVVGVSIDDFTQTVGNTAVEVAESDTVNWTLEVQGNGLARTFGLAVEEIVPGVLIINTNGCRVVVQIVNG